MAHILPPPISVRKGASFIKWISAEVRCLFLLLLVAAGFSFSPVRAQLLPVAPANSPLAQTITGVENTGIDARSFIRSGPGGQTWCTVEAIVSDGVNSGLWTTYLGALTFTPFGGAANIVKGLKDPDVVVTVNSTDGYLIHVVGIHPISELVVLYRLKKNDACSFQVNDSCFYGRASSNKSLVANATNKGKINHRYCSSPNIDANMTGQIAVTWVENTEYVLEETVGKPYSDLPYLIFPNPRYRMEKRGLVMVVRGESDIASGCLSAPCNENLWDIDYPEGSLDFEQVGPNSGGSYNGITVASKGSPVGYADDLSEPGMHFDGADVAISEIPTSGTTANIRIVVSYNAFRPFSGDRLEITSFDYNNCNVNYDEGFRGNLLTGTTQDVYSGTVPEPRIAKPLAYTTTGVKSYAVVWAKSITTCGATGFVETSEVKMVSRNGNTTYGPVTLNTGLANQHSNKAVVAIRPRDYATTDDNIVVAWATKTSSSDWDVVARTYSWNGTALGTGFSPVSATAADNVGVPAITTRMAVDVPLYGWANVTSSQLEKKMSDLNPGASSLTSIDPTCDVTCFFEELGTFGSLQFSPNPTDGLVTLQATTTATSRVKSGSQQGTLELRTEQGIQVLNRKTNLNQPIHLPKLPAGTYNATFIGSNSEVFKGKLVVR